jgi:thymidylate synthase
MRQYLDTLKLVLDQGTWLESRTGIRRISFPGVAMRFDLAEGFPAVTTRKLPFKSAIGELCAFLRGATSAAQFRALGSRVWDQNANENQAWLENPYRAGEDDLGPIYGAQWRSWDAYKVLRAGDRAKVVDAVRRGYKSLAYFDNHDRVELDGESHETVGIYHRKVDQLRECLDTIMSNPDDRRILFHAWNPAQLDEMALPPCHLLYQFLPNSAKRELSMSVYIRSNDLGLGAPFNICEAAALLSLVARLTGYSARWLAYFVGDAHIYENQMEMVEAMLEREPYLAPHLVIDERVPDYRVSGVYAPEWLDRVEPADFRLEGYRHHASLTAAMAV